MKKTLAFGLAMLPVLLALTLTLPRPGTGPHPVPQSEAAVVLSQQDARSPRARRVAYHATLATQPSRPIDAGFLAAVEAEPDLDRKSEALDRVVQSVSDADLPAVLDALASDPSPVAADLRQLLVRRWAERDAPAAAAWTAGLPEDSARRAALEQVAIAWANTDLPAATAWVQAMPAGASKEVVALSLGYEASRSEPITALVVASALPPGPQRDDLLVHAVSQWAAGDSAVAADWAAEVPNVSLRERLLAAVAVSSAEKDGAAAATLAANTLGAGDEQDRAVVSIVQRWAQNSPYATASWIAQWPDTSARDAATQNLLALWTVQDTQAAATWLYELPEGALRNIGLSAYSRALADGHRSLAAAQVTDPMDTLKDGHSGP
jgi:hypothetical protein